MTGRTHKFTNAVLASLTSLALPLSGIAQVSSGTLTSPTESLSTEPILASGAVTGLVYEQGSRVNPLQALSTEPILVSPLAAVEDSDGDGLADASDNCRMVANSKFGACDSDGDGYGNACDGDFNQDGSTDGMDFVQHFLADFQSGVDSGAGTDMDCDGVVTGLDFADHFLPNFLEGQPGPAAADDRVIARKARTLGGQVFVFEKREDGLGRVSSVVLDSSGREVAETALPSERAPIIDGELQKRMEDSETQLLRVQIALEFPEAPSREASQTGEVETAGGRILQALINGEKVSESILTNNENMAAERHRREVAERVPEYGKMLQAWADQNGLGKAPGLAEALESSGSNLVVELSPAEIRRLAESQEGIVQGIEAYVESQDDIASAMLDTNLSAWALPYPNRRANGVGIYMTESGCAQEFRFANYQRLAGTETNHSRNVGGILKGAAPENYLYCRGGAVLPTVFDLYGALLNDLFPFDIYPEVEGPRIQVVTRSNSSSTGTNYTTTDRNWDNFIYTHMIPTFKSASNTGGGTGNIGSPGKGLNIVTVGNYDHTTDTIAGSSSFVDPFPGVVKPEISAPGQSITAGGFTMSGTSMSTPHAAAFVADQMSDSTWLKFKPHLVKAKIISAATDPIAGGFDAVGFGGIDFLSGHYNGYNYWWSGNNGAFSSWDSADGSSDGYVERQLTISNSWDSVRVVLSWLTRGSYTYTHRTDAHPIGMDLDLRVYDPSGNLVGTSASWDNNFESVEFTPTVTGTYTFKINRYANRDTSNKLRMGLVVNYFN